MAAAVAVGKTAVASETLALWTYEISHPDGRPAVSRRYRAFAALHDQLSTLFPDKMKTIALPPRIPWDKLEWGAVDERRVLLQEYLRTVLQDGELAASRPVQEFLDAAFSDSWPSAVSTKEGYLVKRGHRVKNWKRRYFVLRKATLEYFQAKTVFAPSGVVSLSGASVKLAEGAGRPFCFEVATAAGKSYLVQASSELERTEWMDAIEVQLRATGLADSEDEEESAAERTAKPPVLQSLMKQSSFASSSAGSSLQASESARTDQSTAGPDAEELAAREQELAAREQELAAREQALATREAQLSGLLADAERKNEALADEMKAMRLKRAELDAQDTQRIEFLHMLTAGVQITRHSGKGRLEERYLWCSQNLMFVYHDSAFQTNKSRVKAFNSAVDIADVCKGCGGGSFPASVKAHKLDADAIGDACLSIVLVGGKTIDLQFGIREQRDDWFNAIRWLADMYRDFRRDDDGNGDGDDDGDGDGGDGDET